MKPRTVFGLREQGAMLTCVERLGELPEPSDLRPWKWFPVEHNDLPYEVEGRSLDGARAAFELWLAMPVEVDWIRRVWS